MLDDLIKGYLPQGLPLISTTSRSNAVVLCVEGDSVVILTDYGNVLKFYFEDLQEGYMADYESYLKSRPITTLHERLETQIELLTDLKNSIKGYDEFGNLSEESIKWLVSGRGHIGRG